MMGRQQNLFRRWSAWARVRTGVALALALAACAAPQFASAAGPGGVDDEPIASPVDPEDDRPPRGYDDAEREPPPLLSEREVDGGIDIRMHRMQQGHNRRAQRWREQAADATGDEARPLPPEPPPRAGVYQLDDEAD